MSASGGDMVFGRLYPLGFLSTTFESGETRALKTKVGSVRMGLVTSGHAFVPHVEIDRLVVPSSIASRFRILDLQFGTESMMVALRKGIRNRRAVTEHGIAASAYGELSEPADMRGLRLLLSGEEILLTVQNISKDASIFCASFFVRLVKAGSV
jgi:hypothetical protein